MWWQTRNFFFSWNSFYIHFKTLKKHYTVINIMPPIMYYFKGFFIHVYFFLLLYFFWKVYTKIKNRFSENNYKTNLVFFYYITFEWSPEGDMIEKIMLLLFGQLALGFLRKVFTDISNKTRRVDMSWASVSFTYIYPAV